MVEVRRWGGASGSHISTTVALRYLINTSANVILLELIYKILRC